MDGLHRVQIWPVSRLHLIRFSFDISWIASSMKMLQCKQVSTDFWAPNGCGPIHLQDSSSSYTSRIARYFSLNNDGKFSHPFSFWGCVPWGRPFKAQGVLGETKHWEPKSWFTNCDKLHKPVSRQKNQLFVPHIERRSFLCSQHNPCYSSPSNFCKTKQCILQFFQNYSNMFPTKIWHINSFWASIWFTPVTVAKAAQNRISQYRFEKQRWKWQVGRQRI